MAPFLSSREPDGSCTDCVLLLERQDGDASEKERIVDHAIVRMTAVSSTVDAAIRISEADLGYQNRFVEPYSVQANQARREFNHPKAIVFLARDHDGSESNVSVRESLHKLIVIRDTNNETIGVPHLCHRGHASDQNPRAPEDA